MALQHKGQQHPSHLVQCLQSLSKQSFAKTQTSTSSAIINTGFIYSLEIVSMCITPVCCFPATPLQLYSSTNPHHAGKRKGLFRATLNLLFQSCILALRKKFSSCSSSHFATQSLAWCNHRIPRCLLSGPNNTTVVDYHCTETVPVGRPQISLSFLLFVLFCLFLEIRLRNWTNYSRLRGCFMWGAELFSFFLMPWPTLVFKYQQLFLPISAMPTALQTSKGRNIRTHSNDASQVTVKERIKLTTHFLNTSSL